MWALLMAAAVLSSVVAIGLGNGDFPRRENRGTNVEGERWAKKWRM